MNCELELLASEVLVPSREFFIALAVCVSTLICKLIDFYFIFLSICKGEKNPHVSLTQPNKR